MRIIKTLGIFLALTGHASATEETPDENRLHKATKSACKSHLEFQEQKNSCATDSTASEFAEKLNKAHSASKQACISISEYRERSKQKYQDIIKGGEDEAHDLAEALKTKESNQVELLRLENQGIRGQLNNFRERNQSIRNSFASYIKIHDLLSKLEKHYDGLLVAANQGIGPASGEGEEFCPRGQRNWFRGRTSALEREVTAMRKTIASQLQELNKTYQKNLVAAGASREQAITMAKAMARMGSDISGTQYDLVRNTDLNLEALRGKVARAGITEEGNKTTIDELGQVRGADRGFFDRNFVTRFGFQDSHEKEWASQPCPPGSEASACYNRVYKARGSGLNGDLLSVLAGETDLPNASSPGSDPHQESEIGAPLAPQAVLSPDEKLLRFPTLENLPPHAAHAPQGKVSIDGKEFSANIFYERDSGSRLAFIPDGAGNFRIVESNADNVKFQASLDRFSTLPEIPDHARKSPAGSITVDGQRFNNITLYKDPESGNTIAYIPDGQNGYRIVNAHDTGVSLNGPGVLTDATPVQSDSNANAGSAAGHPSSDSTGRSPA